MPAIILHTLIRAAPAVCFDLARDAAFHVESARATSERIVAGRREGLWQLGEEMTFEGVHLGVRQQLSARVVEMDFPRRFRDQMTRGAFDFLSHTHIFDALPNGRTRMTDILQWRAPFGWAGALASDALVENHLRDFLRKRAWHLKTRAEMPPLTRAQKRR